MKRFTNIALLALLILCPTLTRAENVTHNYNTLFTSVPRQLEITNSNKSGNVRNGEFYYTCEGDGRFGVSISSSGEICINLPNSSSAVNTQRISNLQRLRMVTQLAGQKYENIKVKFSTDSLSWTTVVADSMVWNKGEITAKFAPGNYFVKVYNTTSTAVSIMQTTYTILDNCNCFPYAP